MNLKLENINNKNKIKYLANGIKYLVINQHNFNENIMIKRILKYKNNIMLNKQVNKNVQRVRKFIVNANIKNIYKKLKEGNII